MKYLLLNKDNNIHAYNTTMNHNSDSVPLAFVAKQCCYVSMRTFFKFSFPKTHRLQCFTELTVLHYWYNNTT